MPMKIPTTIQLLNNLSLRKCEQHSVENIIESSTGN